jgi:endonuclease/exonuclease/phosphatase family metal-dependent hydrolase
VHGGPRQRLRLVSYNAHFLPRLAEPLAGHRGKTNYRVKATADQLIDYDVIGFSEVFTAAHKSRLISQLNSQHATPWSVAHGPDRGSWRMTDSGLLLVSRFPIVEQDNLAFRHSSRIVKDGLKADGLATKGVIYAKLQITDQKQLCCFLTHLDSLLPDIRERQICELVEFVRTNTTAADTILLLGDFNIEGPVSSEVSDIEPHAEYNQLVTLLQTFTCHEVLDVAHSLGNAVATHTSLPVAGTILPPKRLDYQFLVVPRERPAFLRAHDTSTFALCDDHIVEGTLSDHAAVGVTYAFDE